MNSFSLPVRRRFCRAFFVGIAVVVLASGPLWAQATFSHVTSGALANSSGATGGAWGDANGDGFIDLFVSSSSGTSSVLYTNNGSGILSVDTGAGLSSGTANSWGSAWGDYDNDGHLDLIGSVYGGGNNYAFHNGGNGTFTRLSIDPLVTSGATGNNAIWGDFDNDGYVDAFFPGSHNLLFRNTGGGTFLKSTNSLFLSDGGGQGCAWGDYDNDGFLDLFVTRVNQPNLLYHNNRAGGFTKIVGAPFAADTAISQGCSWCDYDNDGYLDIVVCNNNAKNFLYHNRGDGTFDRITTNAIATTVASSSGSAWEDYDNDGYPDLFIAVRGGVNLLFHNNGDGTFTKVTAGSIVTTSGNWIGGAWADANNDGFPDLFVGNQSGKNAFYLNDGNSNNWLTIECTGRRSNRAAIGAKVRVHAIIRGKAVWQLREISGGGGLASQNDLRAHFGLGDATQADLVRIEWPSGLVQELRDISVRQFLVVKEPPRLTVENSPGTAAFVVGLAGGRGVGYNLQNSHDLTHWFSLFSYTNQTDQVLWTNVPSVPDQPAFFRAQEP